MPKLSLFDHINNIKTSKVKWDSFDYESQKSYEPYMINRFLSMNVNYLEIINDLQIITLPLNKEESYNLYREIIPKQATRESYIKNTKIKNYNESLVELFMDYFECSAREANEYLDTLEKTKQTEEIRNIVSMYGKTEKELKKLLTFK